MAQNEGKGGKHVTSVICVSASGKKTPGFVIAAGKNVMNRWTSPLDPTRFNVGGARHQLTCSNWFPADLCAAPPTDLQNLNSFTVFLPL